MSTMLTQSRRRSSDHFMPEDMEPQEQRRLRGLLDQIDYAAYVANRELIGHALSQVDVAAFQKLAVLTAQARARWGPRPCAWRNPARRRRPIRSPA
uniref:hypothetical protein n=1 Tax=Brevundimonas sp. LF-1 TaxID=3126100 RepID=UPI00403DA69E